jgi:hypothetical protein
MGTRQKQSYSDDPCRSIKLHLANLATVGVLGHEDYAAVGLYLLLIMAQIHREWPGCGGTSPGEVLVRQRIRAIRVDEGKVRFNCTTKTSLGASRLQIFPCHPVIQMPIRFLSSWLFTRGSYPTGHPSRVPVL